MFPTSRSPGPAPARNGGAREPAAPRLATRPSAARAGAVRPLLAAVACGALSLAAHPVRAQALDDRWYVGVGGGAALLRPDTVSAGIDAEEAATPAATLLLGRDLDERTSVQVQLHALGEAELVRGDSPIGGDESVGYTGADASVIYRFFDSRDRAPRGTVFGASLYGRFGLGFMRRETDVDLENDADVNFGAGAGVEVYLTRALALRAEGIFHDRDAGSANLSLVARFGGRRTAAPPRPPEPGVPAPAATPDPTPPTAPAPTSRPAPPPPAQAPSAGAVPAPPPSTGPGPDATTPEAAPLPDPSTLPETLELPRANAPGAPSPVPGPDPSTLPETLELPRANPPTGTTASPAPGASPGAAPPDPATLPETLELPRADASGTLPDPVAPPGTPAPPTANAPGTLPAPAPAPVTPTENASGAPSAPAPGPATLPGTSAPPTATAGDGDGDGVADADDTCPGSTRGYPVRDNGCALLDGVLSGLRFAPGTANLLPEASEQLDYLANLLNEYPEARVELLAHTDDAGSVREQSILARARLRALGTHLVQQGGVRANRLVLRSFGGTRPLYDNRTAEGRAANNRIEILERTTPAR